MLTTASLPALLIVALGSLAFGEPEVASSLAGQVTGGERGIVGVMMESFLVAGRQEPGDPATLTYGQSVTDACLDIEMTAGALASLAASVSARRRLLSL